MPDTLTQASLAEIASFKGRPCLSLYQPTHRRHPDNQQDPIRFRHLVKALETSLLQQHATDAVKALLEPFEAVAAPRQAAQQAAWSDAYAAAAAKGLGSEDLAQIAHAAVAGRVATLLIEAERQVAGRIDASTGRIDPADLGSPRVDDVLDDLGALVESMGGLPLSGTEPARR